MRYHSTKVDGAWIVELEPRGDERGFFARMFDAKEFAERGMDSVYPQINTSFSARAATLRGLHYQVAPSAEAKLVKCIRGRAFDVVVDVRRSSPTFGRWEGVELSAENRLMLYVPPGCAHGFLTLDDQTEMLYPASSPYSGVDERVLRWNDPKFAVAWPRAPEVISDKDQSARDYDPEHHSPGV